MRSALNRVLILAQECGGKTVQSRTGIMDLQNKNIILVAKQVSYRILVPMSYISFWVQEKPAGALWPDKSLTWAGTSQFNGWARTTNSH